MKTTTHTTDLGIKLQQGFSKKSRDEKIRSLSKELEIPHLEDVLKNFHHPDISVQRLIEEFSENTLSNYYFPFSIAPNFLINNKLYHIPMTIEESSVVAAASKSAKFWASRGGFHADVISTTKIGQVHFIWKGDVDRLKHHFDELKENLLTGTEHITANMVKRGGGIKDISLIDLRHEMPDYFQLKAEFETVDSMGANFINSCLEEFSIILKSWLNNSGHFHGTEKEADVIMSILSNYTPDCLVETSVSAPLQSFAQVDNDLTASQFVTKFARAVEVARIDPHRATTHNKGIFNGIDAVVLATGNDFRAVEAGGHTYAARSGKYSSLTSVEIENDIFTYKLKVPMSLGTVGGLTRLHPMARLSLEILHNPNAEELMRIASAAGLANNFAAIKSLVTKGIQLGHMKMHLLNILNSFNACSEEKELALQHFEKEKVSHTAVRNFIETLREQKYGN